MRLLAVAILAMSPGCAGELANPERFAGCETGQVEQMFIAKCGGCHGAEKPDAALDLVSPGVGERVRGLTSTSVCEGRTLVDPAGETHLIVEKVEDAPPCGSRMPLAAQALSPNEIECLRRWSDDLAAEAP